MRVSVKELSESGLPEARVLQAMCVSQNELPEVRELQAECASQSKVKGYSEDFLDRMG